MGAFITHPTMAQWYVLITLLPVIAVRSAEGLAPIAPAAIQATPDCSQLGEYALRPDNLRKYLAAELLVRHPGRRGVSVTMKYQCALEGLAGQILENPNKPVNSPVTLRIFPLYFEKDAKDVSEAEATKEAIDHFGERMRGLASATGFGCNHVEEYGKHKYLCLFKLNKEIEIRRN